MLSSESLCLLSSCFPAYFISYIHERATHFQKLKPAGLTFVDLLHLKSLLWVHSGVGASALCSYQSGTWCPASWFLFSLSRNVF